VRSASRALAYSAAKTAPPPVVAPLSGADEDVEQKFTAVSSVVGRPVEPAFRVWLPLCPRHPGQYRMPTSGQGTLNTVRLHQRACDVEGIRQRRRIADAQEDAEVGRREVGSCEAVEQPSA
jgi:hypothetical protein